jgi:hypothetical protein
MGEGTRSYLVLFQSGNQITNNVSTPEGDEVERLDLFPNLS